MSNRKIEKVTLAKIKKRRSTLAIVFIILLVLAVFCFINSNYFNVQAIRIQGNFYLDSSTIKTMAGIPDHINIFKLNLYDIEEKLDQNHLIEDVSIEREFPSTIIITLTERIPVGVIVLNGHYIEIDNEGIVLSLDGTHFDIPFITGCKGKIPSIGNKIDMNDLDFILDILKQIEKNTQLQIAEINMTQKDDMTFFTNDAITVYVGSNQDIGKKIKLLNSILNDIHSKNQDVGMIDIRNGKQAVVK